MGLCRRLAVLCGALIVCANALANAGVPMLALMWPAQWLALVPIVGIEALIFAREVGLSVKSSLWPIAKANLLSTFVGLPIAWAMMLAVEFLVLGGLVSALPQSIAKAQSTQYVLFPFSAAWVAGSHSWEIPAAFLVMAVPFCAISIYIEHWYLKRLFPSHVTQVKRSVRLGNLATYALLCVMALCIAFL